MSDLADQCSRAIGILADLRDNSAASVCEEAALSLSEARGCLDDVISGFDDGTITEIAAGDAG